MTKRSQKNRKKKHRSSLFRTLETEVWRGDPAPADPADPAKPKGWSTGKKVAVGAAAVGGALPAVQAFKALKHPPLWSAKVRYDIWYIVENSKSESLNQNFRIVSTSATSIIFNARFPHFNFPLHILHMLRQTTSAVTGENNLWYHYGGAAEDLHFD